MKTRLLLLAAFATFTFTACDNDDDEQVVVDPQQNKTQMIASQEWLMISAVEVVNGQTIDNFANVPVTSQDDVFTFSENGEAVRDEGKTKVVGEPQIVETAPWVFMDEERMLKVDFVSLPTNDEIVEITPEKLVLRNVGPSSTIVTTFEAQ